MTTGISKTLHKNLTANQLGYIVRSGFSGEVFTNYKHGGGYPHILQGYGSLDKVQEYSYNSVGYRCREFRETPYLLCSGDSYTFGVGIPEEGTWPSLLAKSANLKLPVINLALGGASVESIVDDVFHYIKTYGPPKNLFIVFPDFCRGVFFSNPDVLIACKGVEEIGPSNVLTGHLMNRDQERPSISKRPHLIEDVISTEHLYMSAFRQIRHLEDFCLMANINFKWSVWQDALENNLIQTYKSNKYFSQYLDAEPAELWRRDMDNRRMTYNNDETCHVESREMYKETFELASDIAPRHDGVHKHMHIAEKFFPYLID